MDTALTPYPGNGEDVAAPEPQRLTKRQKAAVVVRFLLNEGTDLSLARLPAELQSALAEQMGQMRYIDRATLHAVVGEFLRELEAIGLFFPGGVEGALALLQDRINPETAAEIRGRARGDDGTDPWPRLAKLPPETLLPILETESAEVGAVLLSKIEVTKAADLLGRLPGPRARQLSYAVSMTGAVAPDTVRRIGRALAQQVAGAPPKAFAEDPVTRIGAILDASGTATRDDVISGLEDADAAFAADVRKAMFTFEDIPSRLEARDVPRLAKRVAQRDLVTALAAAGAGADAETAAPETAAARAAEFLLSNMSQRMAGQLREEVGERGRVKEKDANAAVTAVVAEIRGMETAGEIELKSDEETAEE